jgi:hypothetical protein
LTADGTCAKAHRSPGKVALHILASLCIYDQISHCIKKLNDEKLVHKHRNSFEKVTPYDEP